MDRRPTTRTSLACLPCRNQHLKCDASQPDCSRCRGLARTCSYPESRRTGNHRATSSRRTLKATSYSPLGVVAPERASRPLLGEHDSLGSSTSDSPRTTGLDTASNESSTDALLDLYYEHFHCSHPFLLPKAALQEAAGAESPSVLHLMAVMRYIGSFYGGAPMSPDAMPLADPKLTDVPDGFSVQANLLLSLARSMCSEQDLADEFLVKADHQAREIGMDAKAFADTTQMCDPVLAESWRRTWWMLYVSHLNYAVIRQDYTTTLSAANYDVDLPCEDEEYFSLNIPPTTTSLQDYIDREFALEEKGFSSFAYFINATEIFVSSLGESYRFGDVSKTQITVENLEATIAAWYIMLPPDKRGPFKKPGSRVVDQLMFQAHMMMFTSITYIHRPLSSLRYDAAEGLSSCGSPPPPLASGEGALDRKTHLDKVLRAIRNQNQCLIALPFGSAQLSPFMICMIACCTIAHLVAYKCVLAPHEANVARDRIRVCIGILKPYADIWPRAKKLLRELKIIARVLLQGDNAAPLPDLQADVPDGQQPTPNSIANMEWLPMFDSTGNEGSIFLESWAAM